MRRFLFAMIFVLMATFLSASTFIISGHLDSCNCQVWTSETPDASTQAWASSSTTAMYGTVLLADPTGKICQIDIAIYDETGDASGYDYYGAVYTLDGSNNLDTQLALSSKLDGLTTSAWNQFPFSTPVDATTGDAVIIGMDDDGDATIGDFNVSNYYRAEVDNAESPDSTTMDDLWRWEWDFSFGDKATWGDPGIKIYTCGGS